MQGLLLLCASVYLFVEWGFCKHKLILAPLIPRSEGGQVAGQRDPEAGIAGAGAPAPEGVALSSCLISMVCRDPGTWGGVLWD